jgi:8-oxo-dGTP pyrophosphatase MutT (NUDIX family)
MITPPPSHGYRVRDPGDAWAIATDGRRYWGRFGAAGLLCVDPRRGLLMQHRVGWSHFGGTWGIPGGARKRGESAEDAALREAAEEAGVPQDGVRLCGAHVLDLGFWSYVTVFAVPQRPFEARRCDEESVELRWVPLDRVTDLNLHPEFGRSWPMVRAEFARNARRLAR